jgi:AhpD family alkylhydroperoxidase
MEPRIDYAKLLGSGAVKAMWGIEHHLKGSGLERPLQELIKTRVSQMNGCAYCLDMHTKDARAAGETEQRLYALNAWRETPFFSDRERAALEWAEALTMIFDNHAPDDLWERVRKHFSEDEMIDLSLAIAQINAWNRLSISFRSVPGTYQPGQYSK